MCTTKTVILNILKTHFDNQFLNLQSMCKKFYNVVVNFERELLYSIL